MDKLQDAKARCPHLMVVHVATYKEGEKEPGYWDNVDTMTHKVGLSYGNNVRVFLHRSK
jgi:DNA polymerase eta